MQTAGRDSDSEAPVRAAREFVQAVMLEDGLPAAVEAAESPTLLPGLDPISRHLLVVELLEAGLYERLKDADPFDEETGDTYWSPLPYGGSVLGESDVTDSTSDGDDRRPGVRQARRFEQAAVHAHRVMQTSGAIRTLATARYAAHDVPAGTPPLAPSDWVENPTGHVGEFADSFLGPALGLGPYQASRLIEEAAWMRSRTPSLLDEVAHQGALGTTDEAKAPVSRRTRPASTEVPVNLDTVTAIARELQDARPDTCETVEAAVLRRGVHRTTCRQAQRSTRTLVTRHEATAARRTQRKTTAQKQGVWLDPSSEPGLSLLSVVMDTERATALHAAVEERAVGLHARSDDGRTLGQHRTDALFELALRGVTFHVNLDIVVPSAPAKSATDDAGVSDDGPTSDVEQVPVPAAFASGPAPLASAVRAPGAIAFHHSGAVALHALGEVVTGMSGVRVRSRVRSLEEITADRPSAAARDRYRPAESLRDKVRSRDRTCRHPGCTRPGRYTDLDHVRPWPAGRTTLANLHCLCRRHHRAKQAGWRIEIGERGVETWTSPTGRSFVSVPGILQDLADAGFRDTG